MNFKHHPNELLRLLEQLQKFSSTGKNYAKSPYDEIRYEEIGRIVKALYQQIEGFDLTKIENQETGYLTPKVGVNAIVKNKFGEYLLEKRSDDGCWGIPGGWAEVGLTAEENIVKEILEETGLVIEPIKIIKVISRTPTTQYPFTSYHLIFEGKVVSGTLKKSFESEVVAWKSIESINNWHYDHEKWLTEINQAGGT